ncbi:MAG: hypothetical protein K1563_02030 [Candidatus Thiodiazotropha sp. (ex. Lucinisca nassula)]|uniref:hypothetical protein n=1 Tax=Candidatus Thiodiazotropha sp. LNASS1 TaxID=3096260 RepID=UPI001D4CCC4F|nr:hypothetical protein [Candidatus Thiodiazotropha sp. (ex. Lucinisca nassula)]MBW9272440.1 hypothetical protein [Candidatus Thiodiazotropha sp. (ex. Lucinisca nassula)]
MAINFRMMAAVLLTIAATGVNAVHLNSDGAGQIALLPYYTVNNGFITNLTVTNTTELNKAVKVRFHESRIGYDVFDINVYLAPYDVWNATLRMNTTTGLPNLITEDETCTYPDKAILQASIDFSNSYDATTDEDLTEGYVEIIEMGVLADGSGPAEDSGLEAEIDAGGSADGVVNPVAGDRSIADGLRHDATGIPADCSVVADAWSAGDVDEQINGFESGALSTEGIAQDTGGAGVPYGDSLNAGLVEPTGGIKVYSIMLNVTSGAAFVQQATHIDHYTTVAQHYRPDDPVNSQLPSLASGDVQRANMLSTDGNTVKSIDLPLAEYDTGSVYDITPNPSIPMGSNPLPIALVLSADAVAAPYFVEFGVNGETDIVLNFPMRKHGIYNSHTLTNDHDDTGPLEACSGTLNDGINDGETVTLESLGTQFNDHPHDGAGTFCRNAGYLINATPDTEIRLFYYDYEERAAALDADAISDSLISPLKLTVSLPRVINVVSVNRAIGGNQSVLGTPAANVFNWNLDPGFEAGWVTISAAAQYDYATNPSIITMTEIIGGIGAMAGEWTGVPVIGFSAMAADLGPSQLGEVVELYRNVNRN